MAATTTAWDRVGDAIRSERKARGWKPERLAVEANVAPVTVWRVETGKAITVEPLLAIADVLALSLDELFGRCVPPVTRQRSSLCQLEGAAA